MITQRAIVAGVAGAATMLEQCGIDVGCEDSVLSYMPLAHIFDRIIEEFALAVGGSVGYWQVGIPNLSFLTIGLRIQCLRLAFVNRCFVLFSPKYKHVP